MDKEESDDKPGQVVKVESQVEAIRKLVKCGWCGNNTGPILVHLGCFHFGCKCCIKLQLGRASAGDVFNCPECDAECEVPEKGVNGFHTEILQSKLRFIKDLVLDEYPNCCMCETVNEETPSTHSCIACKNHLCMKHVETHTFGLGHVILKHEELENNLCDGLTSLLVGCGENEVQNSRQYCMQCQVVVCGNSAEKRHKKHGLCTIKDAARGKKEFLAKKMVDVKQPKDAARKNVEGLTKTLKTIQDTCSHWTADFKIWGEKVKEVVNKIVDEHVMAMELNAKIQQEDVEKMILKEKIKIQQLENVEEYVRMLQKHGTDLDILENFQNYIKSIDVCLQHEGDVRMAPSSFYIEHAHITEIEKCLTELFGDLQEDFGKLRKSFVENKWKRRSGIAPAVIDGDTALILEGKQVDISGGVGQVHGRINCSDIGSVANGHMLIVTDKVGCTSNILGMDIWGRVNRKASVVIENNRSSPCLGIVIDKKTNDLYISSFSSHIVYKCKGGEGGFIPFITKNLSGPHFLCVTSKQQIIVSNYLSHNICKFDSSGQLLWKYGKLGSADEELKFPNGVCVDIQDNIFIADCFNHRIHHLTPDGRFICFINCKQAIEYPKTVTMTNRTLIISQRDGSICHVRCIHEPTHNNETKA